MCGGAKDCINDFVSPILPRATCRSKKLWRRCRSTRPQSTISVSKAQLIDPCKNHTGPFRLLDLPNDLLFQIVDELDHKYPILLVCRSIHELAARFIYQSSQLQEWDPWGRQEHTGPDTMMLEAAREGHLGTMKHLWRYSGIDLKWSLYSLTALHQAALNGNLREAQFLLDCGVCVDPKTDASIIYAGRMVNKPDQWWQFVQGATPLLMAASMGHFEMVNALLEAGADPDIVSHIAPEKKVHILFGGLCGGYGFRIAPLRYRLLEAATVSGNLTLISLTIKRQRLQASDILPAIEVAIYGDSPEIVSMLMKHCGHQADSCLHSPMCDEGCDKIPLHLAAEYGAKETMKMLILEGADLEKRNQDGRSPLFHALSLQFKFLNIIWILVKNGANTYDSEACQWLGIHHARERCTRYKFPCFSEGMRCPWTRFNSSTQSDELGQLNMVDEISRVAREAIPIRMRDWWDCEIVDSYIENGEPYRDLAHYCPYI